MHDLARATNQRGRLAYCEEVISVERLSAVIAAASMITRCQRGHDRPLYQDACSGDNLLRQDLTQRQMRRLKHAADPLVPMSQDRLRAAFEQSPYRGKTGGAALARALSTALGRPVSRQWVHDRVRSRQDGSCRRSIRDGLAKLLVVPEKWLAGEPVPLPLMALFVLGKPIVGLDEADRAALQIGPSISPRLQLAAERLLEKCVTACDRDLQRLHIEANAADPSGSFDTAEQVLEDIRNYLASAILALTSARSWGAALLRTRDTERKLTVAEHKALLDGSWVAPKSNALSRAEIGASLLLLRGFEAILQPWFADEECMNYRRLREVLIGVRGPVATIASNCLRPTVVRRSDGQPVSLADRFTPLALCRWHDDTPVEEAQRSEYFLATALSEARSLGDAGSVAEER